MSTPHQPQKSLLLRFDANWLRPLTRARSCPIDGHVWGVWCSLCPTNTHGSSSSGRCYSLIGGTAFKTLRRFRVLLIVQLACLVFIIMGHEQILVLKDRFTATAALVVRTKAPQCRNKEEWLYFYSRHLTAVFCVQLFLLLLFFKNVFTRFSPMTHASTNELDVSSGWHFP